MGLEAKCTLQVEAGTFPGTAHLEQDRLTFRGARKLTVPLGAVKSVAVGPGGKLIVQHGGETTVLALGDRTTAEKWMLKIRYPRSLIDKLGVKPGQKVAVLGIGDADFALDLRARLGRDPDAKTSAGLDYIFYGADSPRELAKLGVLRRCLQPAGAIWVVSRKGREAAIKDTEVMRAARDAGLVDVKVCSFSNTHTALKLMIPRAAR